MNQNSKRSNTLSSLVRRNRKTAKMITEYIQENDDLSAIQLDHLQGYKNYIQKCSHYTLYAKSQLTDKITLIASSRCTNKACFVCNWINKKTIRRKYIKFFKDNQELLQIQRGSQVRYITKSQVNKYIEKGFINTGSVNYDIMHLTLTVPHTRENGFNGNRYYFKELIERFNLLRKYKEISEAVYGGEFGLEATKTDNGLNIHIHSLLFVKQATQNRNTLHREILKYWNNLTVSRYSSREGFTPGQIEAIIKGNKLLTGEYIINNLNPKGSTLITLENIYVKNGREKERIKDWQDKRMIKSVMEALSYHYEPKTFLNDDNEVNIELLAELLPHVYKQRLYSKIGCLYGEKSLNVREHDTDIIEEFDNVVELFDQDTGEIITESLEYFVTDPCNMFVKDNEDIIQSNLSMKYSTRINAVNTRQALDLMTDMLRAQYHSKTVN